MSLSTAPWRITGNDLRVAAGGIAEVVVVALLRALRGEERAWLFSTEVLGVEVAFFKAPRDVPLVTAEPLDGVAVFELLS